MADGKNLVVGDDVVFSESVFPYQTHTTLESPSTMELNGDSYVDDDVYDVRGSSEPAVENEASMTGTTPIDSPENGSDLVAEGVAPNNNLGRGQRTHKPSVLLKDYVTYSARTSHDPASATPDSLQGSSDESLYPISHYVSCDRFSARHRAFVANLDVGVEPATFYEAMKDEKWEDVMQAEIQALEKNGTWTLMNLPAGKKVIGNKWMYKTEHKADGNVERYKARLVVLRNNQREGIYYSETFAPVAKMDTLRTFLAVAAAKK